MAMGCWSVMGANEMARQACPEHHHRLSKEKKRFKSSWSGAMRTLEIGGPDIRRTEKSTCPTESVDDEVCNAGIFVGFLQLGVQHCLGGESFEATGIGGLTGIVSQEAKVFANEVFVNLIMSSLALCLSRVRTFVVMCGEIPILVQ